MNLSRPALLVLKYLGKVLWYPSHSGHVHCPRLHGFLKYCFKVTAWHSAWQDIFFFWAGILGTCNPASLLYQEAMLLWFCNFPWIFPLLLAQNFSPAKFNRMHKILRPLPIKKVPFLVPGNVHFILDPRKSNLAHSTPSCSGSIHTVCVQ